MTTALLDDLAVALGRIIVSERKRLRMTQEDLAAKLGVSQNAITSWERAAGAHGALHLRVILSLEDAFGLERAALLSRLGLTPQTPDFEATVMSLFKRDDQREALMSVYRALTLA